MDSELVSMIVPIYNVEAYLNRCLDSIVAQTHRPLQVILINDGSKDGSQAIVDRYVAKWPELFTSVLQENQGVGAARNRGVALAEGEWICFIDSDDYIEPNYVKGMLKIALQKGSDIVVSNFFMESANGLKVPFPLMTLYRNLSGEKAAKESLNLLTVPNFIWNKLYRTRLFREHEISFPQMRYEDVAVTAELLLHARLVSVTQKPYYYYCLRKTSIVGAFNERNVQDYLQVVKLVGDFLVRKGLMPRWRSAWHTFLRHVGAQLNAQIMFQIKGIRSIERLRLIREVRCELRKINREVTSAELSGPKSVHNK